MTTLALPRWTAPALSPSATHKLALALVWLTVASGAIVFTEPAPVDVLTMGLAVLLPVIGLVAITPALLGLLAMMLVAAAAAFLAATNATELGVAVTHTSVSLYLYVAAFLFAAFVAKSPDVHARLILNAYTWATLVAALGGIAGYFDLVPGAHALMTRWDRAIGFFKDPNVFGPFLIPGLIYALYQLAGGALRKAIIPAGLMLVLGLALLLSFSRGAWLNAGVTVAIYGLLHILTVRHNGLRLKFAALAVAALAAIAVVVTIALQFDAVADLFAERAALTHDYDVGPDGRFGGQEKAASLAVQYPFGIGAQQFVSQYHHEEPHNVYLAMFLNAGWLGAFLFMGIVASTVVWGLRYALRHGATQPLFLIAYACFVGNAIEGFIIDLDHWRHFYLLMALTWGFMLAPGRRNPMVHGAGLRPFASTGR